MKRRFDRARSGVNRTPLDRAGHGTAGSTSTHGQRRSVTVAHGSHSGADDGLPAPPVG
jgi:hypothetical protein